jgi:uncharacterized protein YwgA
VTPARIELKLTLTKVGIPNPTLGTFSERLNVQKKVYLTQLMGYDLGYRFGWYLRGPYCRELTEDAFTLKDELASGEKDHEQFALSDEAEAKIGKAERLWETPSGLGVSRDQWLELLASVHYLKHIAYFPKAATKDFAAVFKALTAAKPQFKDKEDDVRKAWVRLDEFGLIASKTLA